VTATPTPVPDEAVAEAPAYLGQSWWEPSLQSLRSSMREVFEDRAGARATGARGREHVRRFTPKKVADLMLARAAALLARAPAATPT
jgi:hypothetical protein